MMHSEQINELATALAKAQGQMKAAIKASNNPFFKSRYSDLASVMDACREPLAANGLAIVQTPSTTPEGHLAVTTMLVHQSGQWLQDTLTLSPRDEGPQAFGSACSYARRYSLAAIVGVVSDDDDAEAAEGRGPGPKVSAPSVPIPDQPPGYDKWLTTYEAVVPFGAVALREAFQKAKIAYREFLVKHDRERHEALKAAAALQPSDKGAA